jgi:hypothetical protein
MQTMIRDYQNQPGDHCGSTAMRSLLKHYSGLELPEVAVFGLGSGVYSLFISGAGMDPSPVLFGRTGSLELDAASALGIDYREQREPDDDKAWEQVRNEVQAGHPTMLTGDILYLDYREFKVHFPSHRFVLLGFDDDSRQAYIADRINVEAEICSYDALRKSRNPPEGMSTFNLWGRFHSTKPTRSLEEAARIALERCTRAMLATGPGDMSVFEEAASKARIVAGVDAVRAFADDLPSWAERADRRSVASYNASCIEKFGNGGGNFRRLYAGFLEWAHRLDPELVGPDSAAEMIEAADLWTGMSGTLYAASRDDAAPGLFDLAAEQTHVIADTEQRLFQKLADRL